MTEMPETAEIVEVDPAMPAEGLLVINRCSLCEGDHGVVKARPLSVPMGVYGYYFVCPDRVEPVPVALLQLDGREARLPEDLAGWLMDAILSGRYMVAVWRPEQVNGRAGVHQFWLTSDFPRGLIPEAIDRLEAELRHEVDPESKTQIRRAAPDPRFRAMFRERHEE